MPRNLSATGRGLVGRLGFVPGLHKILVVSLTPKVPLVILQTERGDTPAINADARGLLSGWGIEIVGCGGIAHFVTLFVCVT